MGFAVFMDPPPWLTFVQRYITLRNVNDSPGQAFSEAARRASAARPPTQREGEKRDPARGTGAPSRRRAGRGDHGRCGGPRWRRQADRLSVVAGSPRGRDGGAHGSGSTADVEPRSAIRDSRATPAAADDRRELCDFDRPPCRHHDRGFGPRDRVFESIPQSLRARPTRGGPCLARASHSSRRSAARSRCRGGARPALRAALLPASPRSRAARRKLHGRSVEPRVAWLDTEEVTESLHRRAGPPAVTAISPLPDRSCTAALPRPAHRSAGLAYAAPPPPLRAPRAGGSARA